MENPVLSQVISTSPQQKTVAGQARRAHEADNAIGEGGGAGGGAVRDFSGELLFH